MGKRLVEGTTTIGKKTINPETYSDEVEQELEKLSVRGADVKSFIYLDVITDLLDLDIALEMRLVNDEG